MYKPSTSDLKFNKEHTKRVEEALTAIKEVYADSVIEVCLFGSYANGNAKKFSSIDLIVVIEESDKRFTRRNADLQRVLNETDEIPQIEPLVYTQEEIIDLINKKESFIVSALHEAIVIWNGFNDVNLTELADKNALPSRFYPMLPDLEDVDA